MRVPVEIVIDGVILALATFAAKAHVYSGNSTVIQKRSIIGPVAQSTNAHVRAMTQLFASFCPRGVSNTKRMSALPDGDVLFRVINVPRNPVEEALQRVRSGDTQKPASVVVGVDISNRMLLKFVQMGFQPFRGTDQAGLFTIPRGVNNGAFGPPALFVEFTQGPRFFQDGNHTAQRIAGPVDPGIVMIAAHDPLVCRIRAGEI